MFLIIVVEAHKLHLSMNCQVERACSSEISLWVIRVPDPGKTGKVVLFTAPDTTLRRTQVRGTSSWTANRVFGGAITVSTVIGLNKEGNSETS